MEEIADGLVPKVQDQIPDIPEEVQFIDRLVDMHTPIVEHIAPASAVTDVVPAHKFFCR